MLRLIGWNTSPYDPLRCVTGAYVVVLRELCAVLAAYLMKHLLLRARFSEWGALLLHQEVCVLPKGRSLNAL